MNQSLWISVALSGLAFASCKKSNNPPPPPSVNYQLKATNSSYTLAKNTTTANIVWTSAIAYPDVVKFVAKQNNLTVSFTSTNKGAIDLLAPVPISFGTFVLPTGNYDGISLKIDLGKTGTVPVLQLGGSFTSGIVTCPVALVVTNSIELTTDQENVTISNDSTYTAVTTIDLSSLTSGITATMLLNAQLSGGTIVISADSNHDLYDIVLDHLQHENHHTEFEHHHHDH